MYGVLILLRLSTSDTLSTCVYVIGVDLKKSSCASCLTVQFFTKNWPFKNPLNIFANTISRNVCRTAQNFAWTFILWKKLIYSWVLKFQKFAQIPLFSISNFLIILFSTQNQFEKFSRFTLTSVCTSDVCV